MSEEKETTDWRDQLTDQQKNHIEEGLADAKAGRVMSSKEFWQRLKSCDDPNSLPASKK